MKCKYDGKTYEIVEEAGETIRIKNDEEEFCILKANVQIEKVGKVKKSDSRP